MSKAAGAVQAAKTMSLGAKLLITAAIVVAVPVAAVLGGYVYAQSVYTKNVQASSAKFADYPVDYTAEFEPDEADIPAYASKDEAKNLSLPGLLGAYSAEDLAKIKSGTDTPIFTREADKNGNFSMLLIETVPYAENDPAKDLVPDGRQKANSVTVLYFNGQNKRVRIVKLEPETLVPVYGFGMNTLQGAYAIGGAGMLVNSVNDFYNTSIKNYFEVNLDNVIRYADKAGGVKLNITQEDIDRFGLTGIQPGENKLTGDNAHALLTRDTSHQDPSVRDLQQDYYQGLYNMIFNGTNLSAFMDFSTENRIGTNMSLLDFILKAWDLRWAASSEMEYTLTDLPDKIDPANYVVYKDSFVALKVDRETAVSTLADIFSD